MKLPLILPEIFTVEGEPHISRWPTISDSDRELYRIAIQRRLAGKPPVPKTESTPKPRIVSKEKLMDYLSEYHKTRQS